MARMTLKNPNNQGYRIPMSRAGTLRIESNGRFSDIFGDMVNRLGQFEDLGMEPDEIRKELQTAENYRQLIKCWENEKK